VYSQTRNNIRVPLPYILFTIRYVKLSSGKFTYPGIYGSGLHVYGNLKPLSDFSDKVVYLPTDYANYKGLVCTDHGSDNKKFDSVPQLVNYVVTHWWSHMHYIDYQPFGATAWHEAKLTDIPNGKWEKAGNFRQALLLGKCYGVSEQRFIPDEAKVLDLQWPATLEIKPFEGVEHSVNYRSSWPVPIGCQCGDCRAARGE